MLADRSAPLLEVPRLTTPRLGLREFRKSDFEGYAEHLADPEARPAGLPAVDRRTAWRMFAAGFGFWALDHAGWWAVELLATGEVVGTVGAFFRETRTPDAPRGDLELGWSMYRQHWRKGYASEAAAAALAYGFEALGVGRAIAHIDPTNVASIRVSEHIGMRFEQQVDFYGELTGRHAITPSFYRSKQ